MNVLGIVGYLLPVPGIIATIDCILVIGLVLSVLRQMGCPVGGRR